MKSNLLVLPGDCCVNKSKVSDLDPAIWLIVTEVGPQSTVSLAFAVAVLPAMSVAVIWKR